MTEIGHVVARLGRLARLMVASAVALVLAGGALGMSVMMGYANHHYVVANAAADLRTNLSELADLNGDFARGAAAPGAATSSKVLQDQLLGNLAVIDSSGYNGDDMEGLKADVSAFLTRSTELRLLASRGNFQAAKALDAQDDATFGATTADTTIGVTELRRSASNAIQDVRLGVLALATLVVLTVAGALLWDARRRRSVAEQRVEAESRTRFEAMVEGGSDLLALTDAAGNQIYVSPAIRPVLGYERRSGVVTELIHLVNPADLPDGWDLLEKALAVGRAGPVDLRLRHADGSWRTMEVTVVDLQSVPEVASVLWSSHDVTDRRQLEHELETNAFQDSLSGLPNRSLFGDRVTQALSRAAVGGHKIAVLTTDLHQFSAINDSLGRDAGDTVLVNVAQRLSTCVRPGDTVARMGGDEFSILLEDLSDTAVAEAIAERAAEIVSQPILIDGDEVRVGVSLGIAYSDRGTESSREILQNAAVALRSAKKQGGKCWATFAPGMRAEIDKQLRLSNELAGAVDRGEFVLHYQPTISLATGEIEGAEALLRWRHPTDGIVPPLAFIPLAEENGGILPIGRWVLAEACRQTRAWQLGSPAAEHMNICVNISARQLDDPGLVREIAGILNGTGLDPWSLVLEITESVLAQDTKSVLSRLRELKALGVRLAIDDFGTGYSSLAYLRQFPIDVLKIDRSFVDAATSGSPGGEALLRAIVDLAASLDLTTVAEGIEQPAQRELVRALGCTIGQGYLFARPLPADEFGHLLANGPRLLSAAPVLVS